MTDLPQEEVEAARRHLRTLDRYTVNLSPDPVLERRIERAVERQMELNYLSFGKTKDDVAHIPAELQHAVAYVNLGATMLGRAAVSDLSRDLVIGALKDLFQLMEIPFSEEPHDRTDQHHP